jgi:pyridoxine 5-phosphate synthase
MPERHDVPELIVGLDAIALLRESRRAAEPDPAAAALLAELGGAGGVSIGLRTDRRTGQERDAKVLRATVRTRLQVRIAATPDSVKVVAPIRPEQVILGPERPDTIAHEGHDLVLGSSAVTEAVASLREAGLDALVLIDPDLEQVKAAHRLGVSGVCLTGARLGAARLPESEERELDALDRCVRLASKLGLVTQVGHGLSLRSLPRLSSLPGLGFVEVGHALCARATLVGFEQAVRDARAALRAR